MCLYGVGWLWILNNMYSSEYSVFNFIKKEGLLNISLKIECILIVFLKIKKKYCVNRYMKKM